MEYQTVNAKKGRVVEGNAERELSYIDLNALLNCPSDDGTVQLEKDKESVREYFLQHVNPNTVFFHNLEEKLDYLVENGYYEKEVLEKYDFSFIKKLFKMAYDKRYRFPSFVGAYKFYNQYALKNNDGTRYLERYEDRVCILALALAEGDENRAIEIMESVISGRFQPATPTFLNAGKKQRGEFVSCFPRQTRVLTPSGKVHIDLIEEGQEIISHDGMPHKVTSIMSRDFDGDLIQVRYGGGSFSCTPEHPVLVYSQGSNKSPIIHGDGDDIENNIIWVKAKNITPGDCLITNSDIVGYGVRRNIVKKSSLIADVREDLLFNEVLSVMKKPFSGKVYNLEVEDTHTYVVGGMIVHNCFLLRTEDSMNSICNTITSSLQLSKRGGGVGILLTNLREMGAPIKNVKGQASGVVPVMKLLEDSFSYANQLGARQGAGAVYISCHHPDINRALDTKRENADEKIRIKTLSLGVILTDKAFELAKKNLDMYLFSPYDVERIYGVPMSDLPISELYDEMVEDPRINKTKISARKLFLTIAELQFESGYPYLMFEDTANRWNNVSNVGRIVQSNLCSEILQPSTASTYDESGDFVHIGRDISCNLGSLNIANCMNDRENDLKSTVSSAIRTLSTVSKMTIIGNAKTIREGNEKSRSIGLGAMNLHGFLGQEKIKYGSIEALDFVNVFFAAVKYSALMESSEIAKEKGEVFDGFYGSDYSSNNSDNVSGIDIYEFLNEGLHESQEVIVEDIPEKSLKLFKEEINKGYTPSKALRFYTSGVWETHPHTEHIEYMYSEKYGQWYPTQKDWIELDKKIQQDGLYNMNFLAVAPTGSISHIVAGGATASIHPVPSKIETRKESKIGRVYIPSPGMNNDNMDYFEDAYKIGPKPLIDTYAVAGKHVDQGQSLTLFFNNTDTTRTLNKAYIYAFSRGKEKNEKGSSALFDPETSWKSGYVKTLYYSRVRSESLNGLDSKVNFGEQLDKGNYEECESCTL